MEFVTTSYKVGSSSKSMQVNSASAEWQKLAKHVTANLDKVKGKPNMIIARGITTDELLAMFPMSNFKALHDVSLTGGARTKAASRAINAELAQVVGNKLSIKFDTDGALIVTTAATVS